VMAITKRRFCSTGIPRNLGDTIVEANDNCLDKRERS